MPRAASRRTQLRGREPRERVLDAAIELFATHGFAAVTMRALGEAAGLDNSSLYRHFASKTDLANAVLDRLTDELLEVLAPNLAPTAPPSLDALVDAATAAGRYLFDRPPVARLLMHWMMSAGEADASFSASVRATDTRRPAGRLGTLMNDWLARGMRSGALRRHESPEALVLLIGAVLLRPATHGHLLASQEPRRSRAKEREAWEREFRAAVRGAFAPNSFQPPGKPPSIPSASTAVSRRSASSRSVASSSRCSRFSSGSASRCSSRARAAAVRASRATSHGASPCSSGSGSCTA